MKNTLIPFVVQNKQLSSFDAVKKHSIDLKRIFNKP